MNTGTGVIGGIGLGAGLMYLLDPERGRRRRALARDKAKSMLTQSEDAVGRTSRDVSNRARGLAAGARSIFGHKQVFEDVLAARVRSKIGRLVTYPGAIEVTATPAGTVTLSGPVLASEVPRLITGLASVRGVMDLENLLEPHEEAGGVPGLQGGRSRAPRERFEPLKSNWAPAARLFAGVAGSALTIYGIKHRGLPGTAAGLIGFGMLARGASNREFKRLFGAGVKRRAVDIRKTMHISVPVEKIFEFWANYENFPRLMSHLREVRDLGNGRSHWRAVGPAGISVEWDAEITELVPNEVLAWKSVPGSTIENEGIVRFESDPAGGTQADIQISYNPPAGALGHVIAKLFGSDPEGDGRRSRPAEVAAGMRRD